MIGDRLAIALWHIARTVGVLTKKKKREPRTTEEVDENKGENERR